MIAAIKRLYRMIFCRGGHGVHSPFVFDLLTNVIEEKASYYCYDSLSLVRLQLRQDGSNLRHENREYTVEKYIDRFCFSECEDRLLFRLANRFRPRTIYLMGCDLGLAPLYLTAYSGSVHCIAVEQDPDVAAVAQKFVDKYSSSKIDINISGSLDIPDDSVIDFFVCGGGGVAFEKILPFMSDESIMIIPEINKSSKNRNTWKEICAHPRITVTLDLCSFGIVFFNPRLNRRTYKSFVL